MQANIQLHATIQHAAQRPLVPLFPLLLVSLLAAGTANHQVYLPLVTTTGADAATSACPSPTPTPTPTPLPTPDMTARVTWVIDGDTVRLDNGEYLRYIGIDTPELGDEETGEPPECYAEEALWADLRLVKNKWLNIYFDTEQRDRYNRLLAYAYLPDGTFINAWLAREGYAKTFIISPNTRLARAILDAEDEARAAGRGLWGACQRKMENGKGKMEKGKWKEDPSSIFQLPASILHSPYPDNPR